MNKKRIDNTIINALKYLDEAELNSYVYNEFIKIMMRQVSLYERIQETFIIDCYKIAVYEMNKALNESYFELRVRDGHDLYVAAKHWEMPCGDYVYGKRC